MRNDADLASAWANRKGDVLHLDVIRWHSLVPLRRDPDGDYSSCDEGGEDDEVREVDNWRVTTPIGIRPPRDWKLDVPRPSPIYGIFERSEQLYNCEMVHNLPSIDRTTSFNYNYNVDGQRNPGFRNFRSAVRPAPGAIIGVYITGRAKIADVVAV